ncbi:AraC family transcriptional regulator [Comamonas sp. JC664]|uniref:AraC family transcriptional regulator n=1 Tax=Comamonas sp. JC664 TaxID=2801917 RepID=UPI00174D6CF2|nr:AraC family transcriptional regulator [Comamonas sp. JC664]MBL0698104.1 AraC family transcriptional regulator [Comamonas sp. JC664]GHG88361.1 AraC family transcriptional regulator [Comamonas sp. KCTC 72670]
MDALSELQGLISRRARLGQLRDARLPRLQWASFAARSEPTPLVEDLTFALVLQGKKRTTIGSRTFEYGAGHVFLHSLRAPITSEIIQASAREPFVVVGLALERTLVTSLLMEGPAWPTQPTPFAFATSAASEEVLDAFRRYVRLLDAAEDIPVLANGIEREIVWRAMRGPQGAALLDLGRVDSHLALISRAVDVMQKRFAEALSVAELARAANMSESSFSRHFRKATAMSPLQFQKQLRLQNARSRLIARDGDVTSVCFAVGYQSPSQFSREYRRQFGVSPREDHARLRNKT